jgi:hypothetical protein
MGLCTRVIILVHGQVQGTVGTVWTYFHLNYRQMKLLSNLSVGLELDSTLTESCIVCVQTKAHRATFSASDHIATRPGELVHTDESAIGIPTINGGHKYYVSFTDDYSRFTVIYLLKRKDEGFDAFKQFDARVFIITDRHTSILRSDGGGEFINKNIKNYCKGAWNLSTEESSLYTSTKWSG